MRDVKEVASLGEANILNHFLISCVSQYVLPRAVNTCGSGCAVSCYSVLSLVDI